MRIDLSKLRLFVAVLEGGSITAAAGQCHLSVAAASNRLQELEGALGVRLFDRSKTGVTPTQAGKELARHAYRVLLEVDHLRSAMSPFAKGVRGRVHILANTAAVSAYLPEPLSRFLSAHPEIDVDVREMWTGEILEGLHRQKADLGILADTMELSGLNAWPLADDPLLVVGHPRHMAGWSEEPSFEDCLAQPMVGLSPESALYTALQFRAAAHGKAIHYRVRMRSFEGLFRMSALGVGISIVSSLATHRLLQAFPQLAARPLRDGWAKRRLVLCSRHPLQGAPAYVQSLINALTAHAPGTMGQPAAG